MTKRNIQPNRDGSVNLIKAPLQIRDSIKRYSTTYDQRQVEDNNNLITHVTQDDRCHICEEFFNAADLQHLKICHHTFCFQCLHNYMLYKITVSEEIECPKSECPKVITKTQPCYLRIPQRYQVRYQRYQQFKEIRKSSKNSKKMFCQVAECNGTIDSAQSVLKCNKCQAQICNLCHLKKHQGSCDGAYGRNFIQWRICRICHISYQKQTNFENKAKCKCGHLFCFVCREDWKDSHKICSQQEDNTLEDQVFCKTQIMESSRCWNWIKSIGLILILPFLLIFIALATILTTVGAALFAIIFSPCLSMLQYETSCPKAVFCFPCVGVYKVVVFVQRYVGSLCKTSCDFLGLTCATIKALCCHRKKQSQSNQTQYIELDQ